MSRSNSPSNILFVVTGSIAAFKACQVISTLVQSGHDVQVVATPSALQFVGATSFEGLTGRPVLSDLFARGAAMDHIRRARWADLMIFCPATANTINRLASGLADDLVGTLFLAYERSKPLILAPAMNSEMFSHPKVKESLEVLTSWGVQVLESDFGTLACGEVGEGKLLDPQRVLVTIEAALSPVRRGRVMISGGATREAIDGVRFISNFSSGATGSKIADGLFKKGYDVHYLHGQGAVLPQGSGIVRTPFLDFKDLNSQMETFLSQNHYDGVVHLAAVSDFSVASVEGDGDPHQPFRENKLNSKNALHLILQPNFKIVERLKSYSLNPQIKVIGFKLTHTADVEKQVDDVNKLLSCSAVDLVVHNDLSEVSDENNGRPHIFRIFGRRRGPLLCSGKQQLIDQLANELGESV